MDLTRYRASHSEQLREAAILDLMPTSGKIALDVGARDGYYSRVLAERFDRVVALDLEKPEISHPKIQCVQGNAAAMNFEAGHFDLVLCTEVLEHIPTPVLPAVCRELVRVSSGRVLVGVPYRQDTRIGRTTCASCKGVNPPWGHVNAFDEKRLAVLFAPCRMSAISYAGTNVEHTNALSAALMDLADNPYGTYSQSEPCVHCGRPLASPPLRTFGRRVLTRLAMWARFATKWKARPRANWIHVRFDKMQ